MDQSLNLRPKTSRLLYQSIKTTLQHRHKELGHPIAQNCKNEETEEYLPPEPNRLFIQSLKNSQN